ncbi:hypothetical protein [Alkalihalobacillus sp. LMS39]|uniref:hypothetical protein n=1 Tax=Alkalihalobacillus sp. LMS39 TaxID=2924032 RepID=UPI001FB54DA6|nr:hypothetical protein [Alkalihalobacillus sp. LMS39]UOE94503.1 hypothetical protein MM271_02200 [Alkalihalobacillus sp. LMS39]
MTNKSKTLAFFLSFLPGLGFLYLNKVGRGIFYGLTTIFAGMGVVFITIIMGTNLYGFLLLMFIPGFFYGVSFIDMLLLLLKPDRSSEMEHTVVEFKESDERFKTLLLSFIPGLGHFHIGLMNRGLPFLVGFFGLITMILFVAFLTRQDGFIIFLGLVPIIWIFNVFDVMSLLKRKEQGIELKDVTIFEDFEKNRVEGKKSKTVATLLAVFPGLGHLYLGLQRRGLQLMAAFLFAIYIIDVLRISFFLFIIPLIWFYSIFDAMQKSAAYDEGPLEDKPIVSYFVNHQRWIGIGLLLLGLYYFFDQVLLPGVVPMLDQYLNTNMIYMYRNYLQTTVVCLLLIGGGIKLVAGSKKKKGVEQG